MSWYAYCLTEHQTLPNGTRSRRPFVIENVQGVNGAPVLSYPSGEFAVIVSEYDPNAGELNHSAAIDHARVDVGAVYTKHGAILISAFTHDNADTSWTPDNEAELLIAKLAKTIVDAWAPST